MKTFLMIGAALALTTGSAAAAAAEETEVRTARVSYAGLDLRTEAGGAEMLKRIRKAANRVCFQFDTRAEALADERRCRRAAVDQAVSDLNAPVVTALHGGPAPIKLATR